MIELALKLHECSLRYESWEKRFVRVLKERIEAGVTEITPVQVAELKRIAWIYREQLKKKGFSVPPAWRDLPIAIESGNRVAELRKMQDYHRAQV